MFAEGVYTRLGFRIPGFGVGRLARQVDVVVIRGVHRARHFASSWFGNHRSTQKHGRLFFGYAEAVTSGAGDSSIERGTQAPAIEGGADPVSVCVLVIRGRTIDAAAGSPPHSVSLDLQQSWKDKGAAAKDGGPKDSDGHDHVDRFLVDAQKVSHQENNQGYKTNVVHGKEELLGFTECRSEVSGFPGQYATHQHHASLEDHLGYRKGRRVVPTHTVLVAATAIDIHVSVCFRWIKNGK